MGDTEGSVVAARAVVAIAALFSVSALTPTRALAHPLHTTFTEIVRDQQAGTVTATVKLFADDFIRRVSRGTTVKPTDDAALQRLAFGYLSANFSVSGRTGQRVKWQWCGWKRSADLIFACMRAPLAPGRDQLRVADTMLSDVFADQVNIVQATVGGSRKTLLFTVGEKDKPLG